MAELQIKRPVAVGRRGEEGAAVWLIASRDDIDQGNTNGPAQVYDERTRVFTQPLPLQQWLKFVTFPGVEAGTLPFDVPDDDDAGALYDEKAERLIVQMTGAVKGGPGSGYHAPHVGLPGVHGGSAPRSEAGYAAYVYEKVKRGKKPKPPANKPTDPENLPKKYPEGTPESIWDAADDSDEEAPAKRGGPKGSKVSAAAKVEAKGKVGKAINETLAAIDEVHGDGALNDLPFVKSSGKGRWGFYEHTYSGTPIRIAVSDKADTPMMTAAHEIGHWLDGAILPIGKNNAYFSSSSEAEAVADFWRAIDQTDAIQQLNKLRREGGTVKMKVPKLEVVDGKLIQVAVMQDVPANGRYVRYLWRNDEIWARAYAQYVATRSSNPALKAELFVEQADRGYPQQWSDEDFAPVAASIDKIFKVMGWIE